MTQTWEREGTFTVNNETYSTDIETVKVLRIAHDNTEAFAAVMFLGLKAGRIAKII